MFGSGTSGSNSGTSTYGQSITIGANATPLNSFSFEVNCAVAAATVRGEVYAWDGTKAVGPALFESSPQTVNPGGGFQLVTINVGGLTLPAGSYALFVTTSKDMTTSGPFCTFGIVSTNTAIPNGSFIYINDYNPALWTNTTWGSIPQDLAFRIDGLVVPVVAVPAASTASLLMSGSLVLAAGLFLLFRREQAAT